MIMMALGRGKRVLLVALVVIVAGVAVAWRALNVPELARVGAGYAAQQTCACTFVSGRPLESCMTDLEPLARKLIKISVGNNEVTAYSIGHLRTATARYEKGLGCSLQD